MSVEFDTFFSYTHTHTPHPQDCDMPFEDLIVEEESYESFCEKLKKIDLYFLYNRKLKEIIFEKALGLFQEKIEIYLDLKD